MSESKETPKPGRQLSHSEAEALIRKFISSFRPPENKHVIPVACLLIGRVLPNDLSLIRAELQDMAEVYIYFENGGFQHGGEVFLGLWKDMVQYLQMRQPWEDYDICVFDKSLGWYLGISHENKITMVSGR